VKLSAKTEYACLALLELAEQHSPGTTVRAGDIAARHGIPLQFLVQILRTLRSAGLVESARGAGGGYRLGTSPREITLADVVDVMEGRGDESPAAPRSPCCEILQSALDAAASAHRAILEETTLADLVEASRATGGSMYYI
jgi:Rrf2 family protein